MKPKYLIPSLTLLSVTTFAADHSISSANSSATAVSVVPGANGGSKATITIDVNGKRETREIEIGNAAEVKVGNGTSVSIKTESGAKAALRKTWLGLAADEVTDDLRAQLPIPDGTGLIVRSIAENGPAATAGITKNDVLLKFEDQILMNPEQLRSLVGTKKEGETVRLTYLRRGKESTTEVKFGAREGGDENSGLAGILSGLTGTLNLAGKAGTLDLGALTKLTDPVHVQSRAVIIDKNGNVVTTRTDEINETVKQLEKTLRESGVDGKVIDDTKNALSEAMQSLQKAAGEIGATRGELAKRIEQAIKAATQAVEAGRKAAEEARKQAEAATQTRPPAGAPTAPLPPLEKQK